MSDPVVRGSIEQLVDHLIVHRDDLEHVLVVFTLKGKPALYVGMSDQTEVSWFLRAKEWVGWLLYQIMSDINASAVDRAPPETLQ
jgi:hypothetical protein